jgi:hypothetical protein
MAQMLYRTVRRVHRSRRTQRRAARLLASCRLLGRPHVRAPRDLPAGRAARPLARRAGRRPRVSRRLRAPRHGALAGPRGGRGDRLCLSRLALPRRRRVHGDPAARRADTGAGARRAIAYPWSRALRSPWVALEAPRWPLPDSARARGRHVAHGAHGLPSPGAAMPRARSRTSPTSATSPSCIPGCSAIPRARRRAVRGVQREGHVAALRLRPARRAQHQRVPVFAARSARTNAPHALRAAPALHDRRAHRLGRRRRPGLLLRGAAGQRRALRRLLSWSRATTTSRSPTR